MMSIFRKVFVGLDIDSKEARIAALEQVKGSMRLVSCEKIPLGDGLVKDGAVINPAKTGQELIKLFSHCRIKNGNIILGINNTDILVRFALIPKVPVDKLDGIVKYQAQEYFPVSVSSVQLDYMVVGESTGNEGSFFKILMVAAKKNMIGGFLDAFKEAHIEPSDIDVSVLSVMRLPCIKQYAGTAVVINMDNDITGILLVENGLPVLARISAIGYVKINEYLRREISAVDINNSGVLVDRSGPVDMLMSEIRSSISYYRSQNKLADVGRIFLSGKISMLDDLIRNIEQTFEIPIKVINALEGIYSGHGGDKAGTFASSEYTVAVSLALRGFGGV